MTLEDYCEKHGLVLGESQPLDTRMGVKTVVNGVEITPVPEYKPNGLFQWLLWKVALWKCSGSKMQASMAIFTIMEKKGADLEKNFPNDGQMPRYYRIRPAKE